MSQNTMQRAVENVRRTQSPLALRKESLSALVALVVWVATLIVDNIDAIPATAGAAGDVLGVGEGLLQQAAQLGNVGVQGLDGQRGPDQGDTVEEAVSQLGWKAIGKCREGGMLDVWPISDLPVSLNAIPHRQPLVIDELLTTPDVGSLRGALYALDHPSQAVTDNRRKLGRGLFDIYFPVCIHAVWYIYPDP